MVHLLEAFGDEALDLKIDFMKRVDLQEWGILRRMILPMKASSWPHALQPKPIGCWK
jgi:hypothetical protein